MILVDTNLLLYLKFQDMPQHSLAAEWFQGEVRNRQRVGLPWQSLLGFARIATNSRVYEQPLSVAQAWEQVEEWLALPGVWIPQPTEQHARIVGELLRAANAAGNLVPDAHLAAIAIEHGLEICSTDSDFARFPGVRWRNPLALPDRVREPRREYLKRRARR